MKKQQVWKRGFAMLLALLMIIQSPVSSVTAYAENESGTEAFTDAETSGEAIIPETPPTNEPVENPPVEQTQTEEPEERAELATAKLSISYFDEKNLSNRQEKDGAKLFRIYADGAELEQQPSIILDSETPQETKGIQTYMYTVFDLPLHQPDGVTPISYSVKQLAPIGYVASSAETLQGIEDAEALLKTLATPEVTDSEGELVQLLTTENQSELQAEKIFGNHLPAFVASGKITWPDASNVKADCPDMESYFKTQFTILRNDAPYANFRVEYAQDEADANVWKYTVKGLFTTMEDGSSAVYTLQAGEVEGYELPEKTIIVNGDKSDASFAWAEKAQEKTEEKTEEKNATRAAERVVGDVTKGDQNGAASMEVNWMDPDTGDVHTKLLNGLALVSFTIDDEETQEVGFSYDDSVQKWNLSLEETQWKALGLTASPTDCVSHVIGTGTELLKLSKLPSTIKVEKEDGTQEVKNVKWDIKLNVAPSGYLMVETTALGAADKKYNLIKHTEFDADIVIRNGAIDPRIEGIEDYLTIMMDEKEISFSELRTQYPQASIEWNDSSTGYALKITGIPWCTDDKKEIIYGMKCAEQIDEDPDYYTPHYDNMNSPNFGTNITECHDNGSIILTLQGATLYSATKIWLDDGTDEIKDKRPNATWELWRYSQKPDGSGSYKTASPVLNDSKEPVKWDLDKTINSETITTDKNPQLANGLPKYDTDGFPYVYFTRENFQNVPEGNTYEKVFGVVENAAGDIVAGSDVLPPGITRDLSDTSVYNGGTLSNRITANETLTQKKTWKALAHQNELGVVRVELSLYSKEKDSQNEWEEVTENGNPVTRELTGFIAEIMTKEIQVTKPRYDKLGKELEYRWKETAVYEGDNTVNLLKIDSDTGKITFQLSHNKTLDGKELADGKEWYESQIDADGTIVNKLVGETEYYVDKLWAQLDEKGEPKKDADDKIIYGKDAPAGASISVQLSQDNKAFKDVTLNGQETPTKWAYLWDKLSKFNEDGVRHIYVAEEKAGYSTWHSDYSYNLDELKPPTLPTGAEANCQIKNTPTGVGKSIKVKKVWLDDGDQEHREKITVNVYRTKVDDKNPEKEIAAGVELTANKNWWKEVGVTEYMGDDGVLTTTKPTGKTDDEIKNMLFKDGTYFIREVKMGEDIVYTDETFANPVSELPDKQPNADTNDYVETNNHKYEVTYSQPQKNGEYLVTNRRIGRVNVTVEKNWLDGEKTESERAALDAKISLKCVEYENVVKEDTQGQGYVELIAGKKHLIYDKDDEAERKPVGKTQALTGVEGQQLTFFNLPKYDKDGKVVHYTVFEESKTEGISTALKKADYSTSIQQTDYSVSSNHDGDEQKMNVTNTRGGSKDVVFYKKWIDKYVFDQKKRPDIFLNLYKTVTGKNGEVTVEPMGHVDSKWVKTTDDYNWKCTYASLPKYDSAGRDIVYYATEGMHVDRETLDYIPEQYEHSDDDYTTSDTYSNVDWDDTNQKYIVTHEEKNTDNVKDTTDQKQALKEEGTFVNELRKPLTIQGKKVWKNVPNGFPATELPQLDIIIKRESSTETINIKAEIEGMTSEAYQMNFKFKYEGKNDIDGQPLESQTYKHFLPKYESLTGEMYTYKVTEEVTGGIQSGVDVAYEKLPGEVNDYLITNSYNTTQKDKSNVGTLKINKTWVNLDSSYPKTQYPHITFDIFRFYEKKDQTSGKYSALEKATSVTLKQGAAELLVTNLLVYAPNGNQYKYYVQERNVNGYTSTVSTVGIIPEGDMPKPTDTTLPYTGVLTLTPDTAIKTTNTIAKIMSIFMPPVTKGLMYNLSTRSTDVTFSNAYKKPQESITVSGTKKWKDYENAYSSRPQDIEVTVSRWADAQGAGNSIPVQEMFKVAGDRSNIALNAEVIITNTKSIDIKWDKNTSDLSQWTYTITGLDRYAPNGSPWKYKVKETPIKEYTQAPTSGEVLAKSTDSSNGNITMNDLTNTSYKTATFTKKWGSENPHNLRPDSIKVKLQVKFGTGETWIDASEALKVSGTVPTNLQAKIEDKTIKAEVDGTWKSISYTELPAYKDINGTKTSCFYRIIETEIGTTAVNSGSDTGDTPTYNPAGLYQPEQTDFTAVEGAGKTDATTVTNTLRASEITSLKVVKIWVDTNNAYDTRPKEIKVRLQKTITPDTDSSWENVGEFGTNKPVEHTVKPDTDGKWQVEYKNLPKYDGNQQEYHYRAVEIVKDQVVAEGTTAGLYKVAYASDDEEKPDGTILHKTTITNTLTPALEVSTTKKWLNGQLTEEIGLADGKTVILELKKNGKSFTTPVRITLDGKADKDGERTSWVATFTGMPKFESDGTTEIKYMIVEVTTDGKDSVPTGFWKSESEIVFVAGDTKGISTVTNTQTEFGLDKVRVKGDNSTEPIPTDYTVEYSIYQGATKLATWKRTKSPTKMEETVTSPSGSTVQAESGASAKIKGLPIGTYTLKEESAPAGYEKAADVTFTIGKDGVVTGVLGPAETQGTTNADQKVVLKDNPIGLTLKKISQGGTDSIESVGNLAEFTVKGKFADNPTVGQEKPGITSENIATLDGLWIAGETYTFTETKAPNGYEIGAVFHFRVKADGTIDSLATDTAGHGVTLTDAKTGIVVANTPIEIALKKSTKLVGGSVLPGAVFKLKDDTASADGTEVTKQVTIGTDGTLKLTGIDTSVPMIQGHKYTLTETTAPNGYILPQDNDGNPNLTITFEVTPTGEIKAEPIISKEGYITASGTEIIVKNAPIAVTLTKNDFTKFNHLKGVKFNLIDITDTSSSRDYTTDTSGRIEFDTGNLIQGNTYELYEKTYAGYQEAEADVLVLRFTVNTNGTIDIEDSYIDSKVAEGDNTKDIRLKNKRIPGTIKTTKTDDTDVNIKLAGAEFTLYKQSSEPNHVYTDTDKVTATFDGTTQTDNPTPARTNPVTTAAGTGEAAFDNLPWGTYILKETKAPDGYEIPASSSWEITIGDTGTAIEVLSSQEIQNQKNVVAFQKYDGTTVQKPTLSGTKFALKPETGSQFANTDVSGLATKFDATYTAEEGITWTSDKDDAFSLKGYLIAGDTYILKETKATDGYETRIASYTFTMGENGKITWKETIPDGKEAAIAAEGMQINVYDNLISLTLKKMDGTTGLPGAIFTVKREQDAKEKTGITTTSDGTITLANTKEDLFFVADQTYTLTETIAPDGYEILTELLTFTIKADGTVAFTETSESKYTGTGTDTITVANTKTSFTIDKLDSETSEVLKDEKLALTLKAGQDIVAVWKHTEDSYAFADKSQNGKYKYLAIDQTTGEITGLPSGNYTLSETGTPYGYLTVPEYSFTMKTDGTLDRTKDTSTADNVAISDDGLTLNVTDTVVRGHVALTKTLNDTAKSPLQDVEFKLYQQMGEEPDVKTDPVVTEVTTDTLGEWTTVDNETANAAESGKLLKDGLRSGTYYFVETLATADSVLDATPRAFTITGEGKTQPVTHTELVENEKFTAEIKLTKYDAKDNTAISEGVTFELTRTNTIVGDITYPAGVTAFDKQEQTVGADGTLTFDGLTKGTYHIKEMTADGYDINKTHGENNIPFEATIVVKEADIGETIILNKETLEDDTIISDVKGSYNEQGITNPRLLGSVTLYKMDGEDTAKALQVVEFKLMKKQDGNFIDWIKNLFTGAKYQYKEVASDNLTGEELANKGQLTITDLDWGTYQLVETTAKDGYSTTDQAGKVLATKEFTIDRTSGKVVELNTDGNKFYNYQTKLTLIKRGTDSKSNEAMKNAKFDLTGTYVDTDGTTKNGTMNVTTDEKGEIILKGTLIGGESYTLHETAAPEGYELIDTDLKFTMGTDGKITMTEGAAAEHAEGYYATSLDFFGNIITATDTPIQLQIVKKDADGQKVLTGAEFAVTPKAGSSFLGTTEASIKLTDANMADALCGKLLAKNSYTLTETKAPKGYEITEPIDFTVDKHGKVTVDKETETAEVTVGKNSSDADILTVKNTPVSIKFLKRLAGDVAEEGIEGAEFTLSGKLADGTQERKFTSELEGTDLRGLLMGNETYTLTETVAPDGSMPPSEETKEKFTFHFTVDMYGVVSDVERADFEHDTGISYDKETDTITFFNQPTAFTIFKKGTDSAGTENDPTLAECSFDITGVFAPARYEKTESQNDKGIRGLFKSMGRMTRQAETIRVTTTGEDGVDNALKGRLIVGESYTIKEVMAPNGYQLGGAMTFTIGKTVMGKDGSMKLQMEMKATNGNYDISYDEDGNVHITQRDLPVEFKLRKLDEKKEALKGAEFAITGIFEKEESESTRIFVSDADGYIDLSKLISEYNADAAKEFIYKIEEKNAPTGYQKLEDAIYLRLNSVDQGDGMHKTEAEVLYGEGQTQKAIENLLSITGEAGVQVLNIQNIKTPGTPIEPLKPANPTPRAEKISVVKSAKTGDYDNFGWLLVAMGASSLAAACVVGKRRRKDQE